MYKKISAGLALLGLVVTVMYAGIVGSKHDLRTYGTGGTQATNQVCAYCHTPHNAQSGVVYLWNRGISSTAYNVYDGTYTDPLSGNTDHTYLCMSCHDGTTTAIGEMTNPPNDYDSSQDAVYITGAASLGSDLTNDHPVDLVYASPPLPSTYNVPPNGNVVLFSLGGNNNVLTCATCHEPHNNVTAGNPSFLRDPASNSTICTDCHNL